MMETININGAVLNEKVIDQIKTLQDPINSAIKFHKEDISDLVDFLISIRQLVDQDKEILDHCESLKYLRKTLEAFQVS